MFPSFDPKFFEQFTANPASLLTRITEFQRANFEAAREIAENNTKAFQQLATIRDPQAFMSVQPAILQAVMQQNTEIITRLWQSLGDDLAPPPPVPTKAGKK
ncbi:MAG: phasin family protein [Phaeospirillum sp.]|nr:phasin family protein [Phaeospirillum sp.]